MSMDQYEDIRTETAEAICQIVINRPRQHNTVRPRTLQEIGAALDAATADEAVRAIVLRAEGRHFSAGADFAFLDDLTRMSATDIKREIYAHFQGAARRLYRCPKPTIAAIAGAAVTVGCELALACDVRIVAEDAFFQESWIKLGIMPPLGGVFLLPRLIGLGRASQMVLRAQIVRAEEAGRIGLASWRWRGNWPPWRRWLTPRSRRRCIAAWKRRWRRSGRPISPTRRCCWARRIFGKASPR